MACARAVRLSISFGLCTPAPRSGSGRLSRFSTFRVFFGFRDALADFGWFLSFSACFAFLHVWCPGLRPTVLKVPDSFLCNADPHPSRSGRSYTLRPVPHRDGPLSTTTLHQRTDMHSRSVIHYKSCTHYGRATSEDDPAHAVPRRPVPHTRPVPCRPAHLDPCRTVMIPNRP